MAGSAERSHDWAGTTWRFASAPHRDAFAQQPDKDAPRHGNFCAWAVAAKGEFFSTRQEN